MQLPIIRSCAKKKSKKRLASFKYTPFHPKSVVIRRWTFGQIASKLFLIRLLNPIKSKNLSSIQYLTIRESFSSNGWWRYVVNLYAVYILITTENFYYNMHRRTNIRNACMCFCCVFFITIDCCYFHFMF